MPETFRTPRSGNARPAFRSVEATDLLCYTISGLFHSTVRFITEGDVAGRMIYVRCPYCKSSGYISPPPPRTILMGPCPMCGEPVALYNNKVIGLRKKMLGEGNFGERIQSLARIIMEYINSQGGEVDESGVENIIRKAEERMSPASDDGDHPTDSGVSPSIRNPVNSPITPEEVRDFIRIDLRLLAKKEYFDKYLG